MNFTPTNEQLQIVEAATSGKNLAIAAFAGAAKTTTCYLVSKSLKQPSLYIAFNKSIATEAGEKFPGHVECRTLHSLAYETIIKPNSGLRNKLQPYLNHKEIDSFFKEQFEPVSLDDIFMILGCLKEWCQSASFDIGQFAFDYYKVTLEDAKVGKNKFSTRDYSEEEATYFSNLVSKVWIEQSEARMAISHDTYLKLFHLKKVNLRNRFKIIYLDEAQDSNDVTLSIVYNAAQSGCQIILVGDAYQSIYEWRGAINAFGTLPDSFERHYLTQSFRFHNGIASIANTILTKLGSKKLLEGKASYKTEIDTKKTILCRMNASIFEYCLAAQAQNKKVYLIGDLSDFFSALMTANNIRHNGDKSKRFNKQIAIYNDWEELIKASHYQLEISSIVNFLNRFPKIYETIQSVKEVITTNPDTADYIITTLHKSKGLEWDLVEICDDVIPPRLRDTELNTLKESLTGESPQEEFEQELHKDQLGNLLYVGVTRAKQKLILPPDLITLLGL